MTSQITLIAAVGSALLFGAAQAGAQNLKDWKPGDTVTGDEVDFDKLAGRVVAIEYWGPR